MTTEELYDWIRNELGEMRALYYEGSHALHEEIKKLTEPAPAGGEKLTEPAPAGGEKLYTAHEIIRLVQAAVSDAVCGMSREESTVTAYEIERGIVAELVKEEAK